MDRKLILEAYDRYHKPEYLSIDPLVVVHRFRDAKNLDEIALLSALLAYGRVNMIIKAIEEILLRTDNLSDEFINSPLESKVKTLSGFKYRFHIGDDFAILFHIFKEIREESGSLTNFAKELWSNSNGGEDFINRFTTFFKQIAQRYTDYHRAYFDWLFPSPSKGSPCKRVVMFLRWMVREDDGIDLGEWSFIPTSELFIPVDTHVAKVSKRLKITDRKSTSWKMSCEITQNLAKIDQKDPTKFDFSLCRVGMVEGQ